MEKKLSTDSSIQGKKTWFGKWQTFVLILAHALIGFFIYFGYKEPVVEINSNAFKLKGVYGVNLLFAEITAADTISWHEMPAIAMRTNGISLNKVNRGKYRTTNDEKIHMSIHSGVSPVIKIVEQNGFAYYINRKKPEDTRQIFNNFKNNTLKQ